MDSDQFRAPGASRYLWLAHVLLLLTVYGSLIPLRYQPMPLDQALERFREIRLDDLKSADARGDWAVNMVQYATVSFCYLAALVVDRRWVFGLLAAAVIIPVGCAVALGLEFLQIYFPPRTVSMNDIVVESLGVVLGASAWLLVGQRFTDWLRRFWGRKGLAGLAPQVLPAYLGLLLVVHLMPFDMVFGREEMAEKFHQGRINLVPFGNLADGGIEPLLNLLKITTAFLPVGALLALMPRWSGRGWWAILRVGLGVTVPLEGLKLVVYTRYCDVTAVLTGTAAILLGWRLVRALCGVGDGERLSPGSVEAAWAALRLRAGQWGPESWVKLALAWAAVLLLLHWQPFHFTTDPAQFLDSDPTLSDEDTSVVGLRRLSWAPFVDYYWGSRYQALDQFARRSLSFAPLGVLLALAFGGRERTGVAATVLTALALGALIEGGRYFIPERHPSSTHLLIEVVGAWLGYKLARHAVSALRPAPVLLGTVVYPSPRVSGVGEPALGARPWGRPRRSADPTPPPGSRSLGRDDDRLGDQMKPLPGWLNALPPWCHFVLICTAGVVLSVGFVLVLNMVLSTLGLW